jgi:hypothetical protein
MECLLKLESFASFSSFIFCLSSLTRGGISSSQAGDLKTGNGQPDKVYQG